jgi:hypothetical protein
MSAKKCLQKFHMNMIERKFVGVIESVAWKKAKKSHTKKYRPNTFSGSKKVKTQMFCHFFENNFLHEFLFEVSIKFCVF